MFGLTEKVQGLLSGYTEQLHQKQGDRQNKKHSSLFQLVRKKDYDIISKDQLNNLKSEINFYRQSSHQSISSEVQSFKCLEIRKYVFKDDDMIRQRLQLQNPEEEELQISTQIVFFDQSTQTSESVDDHSQNIQSVQQENKVLQEMIDQLQINQKSLEAKLEQYSLENSRTKHSLNEKNKEISELKLLNQKLYDQKKEQINTIKIQQERLKQYESENNRKLYKEQQQEKDLDEIHERQKQRIQLLENKIIKLQEELSQAQSQNTLIAQIKKKDREINELKMLVKKLFESKKQIAQEFKQLKDKQKNGLSIEDQTCHTDSTDDIPYIAGSLPSTPIGSNLSKQNTYEIEDKENQTNEDVKQDN